MSNETLKLTPVQAIGVALSVTEQFGECTMDYCQAHAPDFLKHLNNMGFKVIENNLTSPVREA